MKKNIIIIIQEIIITSIITNIIFKAKKKKLFQRSIFLHVELTLQILELTHYRYMSSIYALNHF